MLTALVEGGVVAWQVDAADEGVDCGGDGGYAADGGSRGSGGGVRRRVEGDVDGREVDGSALLREGG